MSRNGYTTSFLAFSLFFSVLNAAEEPPEKGAPAVYTVKKEPFSVNVSLKGVFEALRMTEIVLDAEEWSSFKVLRAVKHGERVKEGALLVAFDAEGIDKAIADLRRAQALRKAEIAQAQLELKQAEESLPFDRRAAERDKKRADENLKRFLEVERPFSVKATEQSFKQAKRFLEYELEELRQLEKMYKEDDLTEETEEIVLKRQRDAVDSARFNLERVTLDRKRKLTVSLPRQEEDLREAARPEERLKKLLKDRALMTLKSPVSGIVYYGSCTNGVWSNPEQIASKLKPGGMFQPGGVLMTIVSPRPVIVRSTIPEKDLHLVRPGIRGWAQPVGFPDLKLTAVVRKVDSIPRGSGSFGAEVTVSTGGEAEAVMPGMNCTLKLVAYRKKEAVTVPVTAVFTDGEDGVSYVYLAGKGKKPVKRKVETGKRNEKKVEILKGLKPGDRIFRRKPKES